MSSEVFEALSLLEKERGIPVDFMLDKIRKAIITACKNSYGNEMNHAGNAKNSVKSKNETDCRSKAKNKTSQSYSSEEDRY